MHQTTVFAALEQKVFSDMAQMAVLALLGQDISESKYAGKSDKRFVFNKVEDFVFACSHFR